MSRSLTWAVAIVVCSATAACSDETTASSGAGGAGGATGAGGIQPTDCTYPTPADGIGVEVGQVLPSTLVWEGYDISATNSASVQIPTLHDCDGTHGIHALLLSTIQPDTNASRSHTLAIANKLEDWLPLGIRVAFLMLNNPDGSPATVEGAADFRQGNNIEDGALVLIDPEFQLVSGGQVSTPQNTVVNPRTMEVLLISEGHPFDATALEAMAETNAP